MRRPSSLPAFNEISAPGDSSCPFAGVVKHAGYRSPWESDVVQLDMSSDRSKDSNGTYDLTKIFIQTSGPLSIYSGVKPLTDFPDLTNSVKALLNCLSTRFSSSTKRRSEISQNLNNVLRFFCWMIQEKGIYRVADVTREAYREFMLKMKEAGGWMQLLGVESHLRRIVANLDSGTLSIGQVCPSVANTSEASVRVAVDFLWARTGIPLGMQVPSWFFEELKRFYPRNVRSEKGWDKPQFSYMSAYSHIKALNRLAEIPAAAGGASFMPFPDGHDFACDLTDTRIDRHGGKTANLHIEDAVLLFSEALRWIYEFADGVIAIGELLREYLEGLCDHPDAFPNDERERRRVMGRQLANPIRDLCEKHRLPIETVVLDSRVGNYDEVSRPDIRLVVNLLQTACFIMIAVNHGRRKNEIAGEDNLPYGLYFGCVQPDVDNPLMRVVDIYIEKTVKNWRQFYVNALVEKSVSILEAIAQIMRPLQTPLLTVQVKLDLARQNKLFRFRPMTEAGFRSPLQSYSFSDAAPYFFRRAGTTTALDYRAHPFRRFFSLIYYHRYDNAQLLALSDHLVHLDPGITEIYVRDADMRTASDRIEQLYGRKHEVNGPADEGDEVRSEMFQEVVLGVLTGKAAGGEWPRLVIATYKLMSDRIEFGSLSEEQKAQRLGSRLAAEGYQRTVFGHCGCNVGTNEITAPFSNCARGPDKRPQLELASPELCFGCLHRDCNEAHLLTLRGRIDALEKRSSDGTVPAPVRIEARKEAVTLEQLIKAERALSETNRKMITAVVGSFAVHFAGAERGALT